MTKKDECNHIFASKTGVCKKCGELKADFIDKFYKVMKKELELEGLRRRLDLDEEDEDYELIEDGETNLTETQQKISDICNNLKDFLIEKNKRYGNSALEPMKIFGDFDAEDLLKIRLTDKIMRIKNSEIDRKNDYTDMLGYIILLCVSKDWVDFKDLID